MFNNIYFLILKHQSLKNAGTESWLDVPAFWITFKRLYGSGFPGCLYYATVLTGFRKNLFFNHVLTGSS